MKPYMQPYRYDSYLGKQGCGLLVYEFTSIMYVLVSWQIDEAIYKSVRTLSCNRTNNQQTATCMHVYTNQSNGIIMWDHGT